MGTRWLKSGVTLGLTGNGDKITLPWKDRVTHMHIIGNPRQGKTKLLERMIREDIVNGQGLTLIDPHGVLYDNIVKWLAANPRLASKRAIHLFDPTSPTHRVGFNPLIDAGEGLPISVRVDGMLNAFERVWGGDFGETPRLAKALRAILYVLALAELSIYEAPLFTSWEMDDLRRYFTEKVPDPIYRMIWADFNTLPRREFNELFESTISRLMAFLTSDPVRTTFGQRTNLLNFRQVMDEGEIVLINLVPKDMSGDNARVIGTVIINHMYRIAKSRPVDVSRSHYLYIDEAYEYLTEDIGEMIVQMPKFGLHLILAHHYLRQLQKRSEDILQAVLSIPTKIVFNIGYADAVELVPRVAPERLDTDKVKHVLDKPVLVGHEVIELGQEAHTEGGMVARVKGDVETEGDSQSTALFAASAASQSYDSQGNPSGSVIAGSGGSQSGSARSRSRSRINLTVEGRNWSDSAGTSETLKPELEVMAMATYSLEELVHNEAYSIANQERRVAIAKLPQSGTHFIVTPDVKELYGRPRRVEKARTRMIERSYCSNELSALTSDLDSRQRQLLHQAEAPGMPMLDTRVEEDFLKNK